MRMPQPFKAPNGFYYCRKSIPPELRGIVGKTEIRHSLRTRDPEEARVRYPAKLQEAEAIVLAAREQYEASKQSSEAASITFNAKQLREMARRWLWERLERLDADGNYIDYIIVEDHPKFGKAYDHPFLADELGIDSRHQVPGSDKAYEIQLAAVGNTVDEYINKEKLDIERYTKAHRILTEAVAKNKYAFADTCVKRAEGDYYYLPPEALLLQIHHPAEHISHATPAVPLATSAQPQPESTAPLLSEVLEDYCDEAERNGTQPKRITAYRTSTKEFIETHGDRPVDTYTKKEAREYAHLQAASPKSKAHTLKALPLRERVKVAEEEGLETLSPNSVRNKCQNVSAVFTNALENDHISTNPMHGASTKATKGAKQQNAEARAYRKHEIERVFSLPLFVSPQENSSSFKYAEETYWLMLLSYHHGARVGEMAQLAQDDISETGHGFYSLSITDEREEQHVKNDNSRRTIPLHPELVRLGFLEFAKRQTKSDYVFPAIAESEHGMNNLRKCYRRYLDKHLSDVPTERSPFHGLRHYFEAQWDALGLPTSHSDAITGHSPRSIGAGYGIREIDDLYESLKQFPPAPIPTK